MLQNFKPPVNTWIENFFATQTQHPSLTEPHQELPQGASFSEARHYSKDFENGASTLTFQLLRTQAAPCRKWMHVRWMQLRRLPSDLNLIKSRGHPSAG
ncbi:hypothetical protein [Inhella sp.]|uniref:hypothetical protein n=1 Tax=Inhella sp. TaxID=1921806 RepID=UPI0035B4AB93